MSADFNKRGSCTTERDRAEQRLDMFGHRESPRDTAAFVET